MDGSRSWSDRVRSAVAPVGSPYMDGTRLAIINTVGLVSSLAVFAIVSLLFRLIDWLLPFPLVLSRFVTVVVLVALALWFWYRYSSRYGRIARARARTTRADVFGAIGAIPFAIVAVVLLSTSSISLLLAAITFSLARVGDALQQLAIAALFAVLAAANVIIARVASE